MPFDAPSSPRHSPERLARASVFCSTVFYLILIGVNLDPKVRAKWVEAFGTHPFGWPVLPVVIAATTILYFPIPFIVFHYVRIQAHAMEEGTGGSRRMMLVYILTVRGKHPELARSQAIVIAGLLYCLAVFIAWLVYASSKGI